MPQTSWYAPRHVADPPRLSRVPIHTWSRDTSQNWGTSQGQVRRWNGEVLPCIYHTRPTRILRRGTLCIFEDVNTHIYRRHWLSRLLAAFLEWTRNENILHTMLFYTDPCEPCAILCTEAPKGSEKKKSNKKDTDILTCCAIQADWGHSREKNRKILFTPQCNSTLIDIYHKNNTFSF